MSSAHNANHRPNNTRRHSPNRRVSVPLSASAAASKNSEKRSVSRRSSEQIISNTAAEVERLKGLLAEFYRLRNKNALPRSTLSVGEREKRILDKIKKAEALHEERRAKSVIRQRLANEKARQKENNKAKGIVRPKAALSVNESVAAIRARTAAALERLKASEAQMIENVKQKAQASVAKSAEALAKLEEKCASIGWRKA